MHDRQRHHGPPHDLLVLRAFAHALVGVPTMTQTSLIIPACFIKGYQDTLGPELEPTESYSACSVGW
jgi:hypothetical protein